MRHIALSLALFLLFGALGAGCQKNEKPKAATAAQPQQNEGTIVAMGDSLTEGYGLPEGEAYPAQLEKRLQESGYRWRVVNAGISGETSSGALSRLDWVLKLKPDIVILETGANDGLRGTDPKLAHANIDQIVTRLQARGVLVVLAGMRMVTNLGPGYTRDFAAIYPEVAQKHGLILIPFFLEGVAGDPALNQGDGLHPVAKGYRIITERIYPYIVQAIGQRKSQPYQ